MTRQVKTSRPATLRWSASMPRISNRRRYRTLSGRSSRKPVARMDKLTKSELQLFRKLSTPEKIQKYLDELPYNKEKTGETCYSPRLVIRHNTAHCFEGALFAAAALRVSGRPPLILDLASVRDDDHVIAVYRSNGFWGAIGKSNYAGLRFRSPVYLRLLELALSYF